MRFKFREYPKTHFKAVGTSLPNGICRGRISNPLGESEKIYLNETKFLS